MEEKETLRAAPRAAGDLYKDYVSGQARDVYGAHFGSIEDRRRAVCRAVRPLAPEVADALEVQQAHLAPSTARAAHLTALRRGAAAVVTGQQVGLFLGPLYTLYKAATAVRVARALSEETGENVVPVFWLQTEDHDLAEISRCHVRTASAPLTLHVPIPANNHVSVAHCRLPHAISECLAKLQNELGNLPHAQEHLSRLADHYRSDARWAQAFAGLLAELFAESGLVVFDPRDPALAALAAPVHRRALQDAQRISDALLEQAHVLEGRGWKLPVYVRESAPLSFFHAESAEGPRYRLSDTPDGYTEIGGNHVHSMKELLDVCAREPARFSTSALLRPILQDTLLPTAAYVGGPAEVAYFAQLPPLYAVYGMSMPLIVPRAGFRIVEPRVEQLLSHLGLVADDLACPTSELLAKLPFANGTQRSPAKLERTLADGFEAALHDAFEKITAEAPALEAAVENMRSIVHQTAAKLRKKYEKALFHQDRSRIDEIERLKTLLYPESAPQERVYGISYFAARYGARALVERVLESVTPFDAQPRDLRL